MVRYALTIACLLTAQTEASLAGSYQGIVVDMSLDAIKVEQGGIKTQTFLLSNELLTNTIGSFSDIQWPKKIADVKKGYKVDVEFYISDGDWICTSIRLRLPDKAGVVTAVGKDTITIRNDKGTTNTYKISEQLADNSGRYSPLYPSRFSEVTPGCWIEVTCYERGGEMVICELDVKKEKEKDK